MGFTMSPEAAQALINKDPCNADVLFEYMNGKDLMQSPTQHGSRWIINFFDWPEERARQYPDCFAVVEDNVKPERETNGIKQRREYWWRYAGRASGLYRTIEPLDRVLCRPITSAHHAFAFVSLPRVIDQTAPVYVFDDVFHFGVLQSEVHAVGGCDMGQRCGRILATRRLMCSRPSRSRRTVTPSHPSGRRSMLAVPV